jgi:PAS domain S-box-containing protein
MTPRSDHKDHWRVTSGVGDPSAPSLSSLQQGAAITMLRHVVAAARLVAGADGAAILLYDHKHARFVPTSPSVAVGLDERWLQRQGLEAAQALALRAMDARGVLDVQDTVVTPELEFPLLVGGRRPGAICVAPLLSEGNMLGVLELYHASPRLAPVHHEMVRSFAEFAGVAIMAARGHERERDLRTRMEVLDAASKVLATPVAAEGVLQRIVEIATALACARYGALGVVGPDGYLTDFITAGLSAEERGRMGPLPRGHGLLGVLIRQGQSLRVPHLGHDPRRVGFPPHHPPMVSLLGVPIRIGDTVVGDLYLTDKIGAVEFSEDDQQLVELLAAHAGIAIENAHLQAREREWHHTLQAALDAQRQQATLIDLAHDAIIIRDLDSRVVSWNQGASETYGWTAEEALGRVTYALLRTVFPASGAEVERALRTIGAWEGELRHARRDGVWITVESRQALLPDTGSAPRSILEINRDISARKHAEATLRFLAEVGTALGASLDVQTTLSTLARLSVPHLADWCAAYLLEEDGDLRQIAVTHADPAGADLAAAWAVAVPAGDLRQLVRAGRSLLVPEVDQAHPETPRQWDLVSWMVVPIMALGQHLGALSLATGASGRRYGPADLVFAEDIAARAGLAVANARLYAQVGVLTQQHERERIGRDLHDGIIQDIYAATLYLENAAEDVPNAAAQKQILREVDRLNQVIGNIRIYIHGLQARELAGRALHESIADLVGEVDGRGDVQATFMLEGQPYQIPDARANTLLHIAREALSNVIKHAQASHVVVRLVYDAAGVTIRVADDGRGFDSAVMWGEEHQGQRNLRQRAVEAGGSFAVESSPGAGTTITAVLPVA